MTHPVKLPVNLPISLMYAQLHYRHDQCAYEEDSTAHMSANHFCCLSIVFMPKASSQMGHFTWGALQTANKSSLLTNEQFRGSSWCFFFSIFSCHIKTGDQPQEDLVRSSYKTNKEVKIMAIF
jgi:hypothetical protein